MPPGRPIRKKAVPLATSCCSLRASQLQGCNGMDVFEILRTQVGRDLLIKEEYPVDSITLDNQLASGAFIERVIPMLVIMHWIE